MVRMPKHEWMALRREILESYGFLCQHCGEGGRNSKIRLEVHHIDWDHENNQISNLTCLCTRCHDLVHYGRITKRSHYFD